VCLFSEGVVIQITNRNEYACFKNSGHKYRLCLHKFFWFIRIAELIERIFLIFSLVLSALISGNLFFCKIFCCTFSLAFCFLCLDFMFQKNSRYLVTYITKGVFSSLCVKNLGDYFQTEVRKWTVTANRRNPVSLQRNIQWCGYFSFHFGLSIRIELMLFAAIFFIPHLLW